MESLPAWTSNRLKRLTRAPKRYIVDPSLAAGALGLDLTGVLRDGTMLGRILETFVVAQIRAEAALSPSGPRVLHLRTEHGRQEVDLVAAFGAGDVIGIEIKADSAPDADAAHHLAWLRETAGDRFVAGVVLHTGPRVYPLGERIWAIPICALWAP